jgi:hypothetical protein
MFTEYHRFLLYLENTKSKSWSGMYYCDWGFLKFFSVRPKENHEMGHSYVQSTKYNLLISYDGKETLQCSIK